MDLERFDFNGLRHQHEICRLYRSRPGQVSFGLQTRKKKPPNQAHMEGDRNEQHEGETDAHALFLASFYEKSVKTES